MIGMNEYLLPLQKIFEKHADENRLKAQAPVYSIYATHRLFYFLPTHIL
jgi:hypothetical protein